MSNLLLKQGPAALQSLLAQYVSGDLLCNYQHCNPAKDPIPSTKVDLAGQKVKEASVTDWGKWLAEDEWSLETTVSRAQRLITYAPYLLDWGHSVDSMRFPSQPPIPCFSTDWIPVESDGQKKCVRLSQTRTAMHKSEALRTRLDNDGIALEITDWATSFDPLHAVTVLVLRPPYQPALYHTRASVHDFRPFNERPADARSGLPPNSINGKEAMAEAILAVRYVISLILEQ